MSEPRKTIIFNKMLAQFSRDVDIPDGEWEFFKTLFTYKKFPAKDLLIQPSSPSNVVFYIGSGLVKRYFLTHTGAVYISGFDGELRIVSDFVALIEQRPCDIFIEALVDTEVLISCPGFLDQLRKRHPVWNENGRHVAELRYVEKCQREYSLLRLNSKQRYLEFREKFHQHLPAIPKKDIASYLGIAPQSLSRIIRETSSLDSII